MESYLFNYERTTRAENHGEAFMDENVEAVTHGERRRPDRQIVSIPGARRKTFRTTPAWVLLAIYRNRFNAATASMKAFKVCTP